MFVLEPTKRELWYIEHPWISHYSQAKQRCNNSNDQHFKRYGGRGIKFELTVEQTHQLWLRDKAMFLNCPSIDRIDNNGDYTFDNCQFIEHIDNVKKMWKERKITGLKVPSNSGV